MKQSIPKVRHRRTSGLGGVKGKRPLIAIGLAGALIVGGILPTALAADDPDAPGPTPRAAMVSPASVDINPGETWNGTKTVKTTKVTPKVDIMFVVDNTGSMTNPIQWASVGLQETVKRLVADGARDINMGIVSYGDNDKTQPCVNGWGKGTKEWFVPEAVLAGGNTNDLVAKLAQISKNVTEGYYCNGLDPAESTFSAIQKVAMETAWRPDAARHIINVTDAPWKIQNNTMAGGAYPSNLAGLTSVMQASDVNLQVQAVNCWSDTCEASNQPAANLPAVSGKDVAAKLAAAKLPVVYAESENAKELNNNIVVSTSGVVPNWDITHATTCVYDDGSPSTDVTVTLNPASASVATGSNATFTESAVGSATPARVDDTTTCTTQFYINGNSGGADYKQVVKMHVPDPGLFQINKTSEPASGTNVLPGSTVKYTVVAENTTKKPIAGATFTDDLRDILDDAAVSAASVKLTGPGKAELVGDKIVWTGDLPVGAKATVTYEAVVPNPTMPAGNHALKNNVSSNTDLSTCPSGSTDAACNTEHTIKGFMIKKTADNLTPKLGDKVTYTITGTNDSLARISANLTDDLSDVLDDADYNGDLSSSVPVAAIDLVAKTLRWDGDLDPMQTVTIKYSVTIKADATTTTGNGFLNNGVTSTTDPNPCPPGDPNPDPTCVTPPIPIEALTTVKTIENPPPGNILVPGATINYKIVATNTGQVDLDPASFEDELKDVLDDATFLDNVKITPSTNGKAVLKGTVLTWTGKLAVGESVTVTYSVKVDNPPKGNWILVNKVDGPSTNCSVDPSLPGCTIPFPVPGLDVSKVVVGSPTTVHSGDTVTYKLVADNKGKVKFDAAEIKDDLTGVLDDATFDLANVKVTIDGVLQTPSGAKMVGNVLTWVGPIDIGQRIEIEYKVAVKDVLGDHNLKNQVVTDGAPGSNCDSVAPGPQCSTETNASSVRITKTANPAGTVAPGKAVEYTVTVVNDSKSEAKGVKVIDDLSELLDDATIDETSLASTSGARPVLDTTKQTITWTGDVPAGATVTLTYKAVAHYPSSGNLVMDNSVTSDVPGSTCPPSTNNDACSTTTNVEGDVVIKTSDATPGSTVRPGQVVNYKVTVLNNSKVHMAAAKFTDDMSDVLDDATYNNDAAVAPNTLPAPVFDASKVKAELTWTGPLAAGEMATITYSVTANKPPTGNGNLANTLTEGGICKKDDPTPPTECRTGTEIGGFTIKKTSDVVGKARPGSDVTYTITGTNDGQADVKGASFVDSLAKVLDDATFVPGSLTFTSGNAAFDAGKQQIAWNGDVAKGQTITVTYKVHVNEPVTGDQMMINTVISDTEDSNCEPGNTDPDCSSTSEVGGFTIKKTSDFPAGKVAKPGTVVNYTVTATNNTLHDVAVASFVDDLSNVLDDAGFNNGSVVVVPNVGAANFNAVAKTLSWSGPLTKGQTVTVKYAVTVGKDMGGDHNLSNGVSSMDENTNCPPNSTDPDCSTSTETGGFNVAKTADVPNGHAVIRGQILTYTVVAHNDSKADVNGAKWTDDLSGVLDDADLVAGSLKVVSGGGNVSIAGNIVTWTGDLAKGAKSTVTYQVKVKDHGTATSGNNSLVNKIKSEGDLGNCPPGNTDPECLTVHPIEGLTIVKTSDVPSGETVDAGQVITYQVKVVNTGSEKKVGATFKDNMTGVLDSAVLDEAGLATAATKGTVTFDAASKTLTWVGDVDPGEEVLVTYRVTVNSDGHTASSKISNKVESETPGTNCPPGNNDPLCQIENKVSAVHISKVVSTSDPVIVDQVIDYTVTVKNTGAKDLTGIYVEDDLTDVLDDAWVVKDSWNASTGTVGYGRGDTKITWTGDLKIGQSATFTYKVNIREPNQSTGNKVLNNVIVGAANTNCFSGSSDIVCRTKSDVKAIIWVLSNDKVDGSTVVPGEAISYKIEGLNWGASNETGIDYSVDLNGVLDDGVVDESSISATLRNGAPGAAVPWPVYDPATGLMEWSGDLNASEEFEVTFAAVVKQPDGTAPGDRALVAKLQSNAEGTNCRPGSTDPRCVSSNALAGLVIKTSTDIDPAVGFAQAGQIVNYTIEASNTAQGVVEGSFSYDLSGLLDDAEIVGDITTTGAGSLAKFNPAGTAIDWANTLAEGESSTTTFAARVKVAGMGDRSLATTALSSDFSNCSARSQAIECSTRADVSEINFSKSVDKTGTVKPGDVVTYTVKINNVGTVPNTGVQFSDNLSEVLDDATFVSVGQDSGKAVFNSPVITWTGDLAAGQSASVTYTVKIKEGRPGDGTLFNRVTTSLSNTNCPAGSTDPACSTVTTLDPLVKVGPIALPVTGIELGRLVSGAGLALLLGALALLIARRRTVNGEEV